MKRFLFGAVVATVAVVTACVGDSGVSGAGAAAGTERGACFTNGTCNSGLQCVDMVCVHTDGGGTGGDAGSGADAMSSPMDGSASMADSGDAGLSLQDDPKNCGTVGHRCPSGMCAQGDCYKRVFVSSTQVKGDLASAAGAATVDKLCQDLSSATFFSGGTYLAWLSVDSNHQPATTFKRSKAPYVGYGGQIIANDWTGLTTQQLLSAISLTEDGTPTTAAFIWTNTNVDGMAVAAGTSATNCMSFTMSSGTAVSGAVGTATPGWTNSGPLDCGKMQPVYCFEQ